MRRSKCKTAMSRNYAHIPHRNEQRGRRGRGRRPRYIILLILLIVAGIFYYAFSRGILVLKTDLPASSPAATSKTEHNTSSTPKKPRFEFYTLLPKETVPVPHEKNATADVTTDTISPPDKPALKPATAPTGVPSISVPNNRANNIPSSTQTSEEEITPVVQAQPVAQLPQQARYILQVAALHNSADADGLKAQLSFLGFDVWITPFQNQGSTWYRVKVGPYPSLEAAKKAQQTLINNHFSSILITL